MNTGTYTDNLNGSLKRRERMQRVTNGRGGAITY